MVGNNTASYTTPQLHSCTIQLNNCSHTASCTVAQYTQFHICTVPQLHRFLHSSTDALFHSFQHSYVAASQDTAATAVMQDSDSENKSHRRSFPNLATCKHLVDPHCTCCPDDLATHVWFSAGELLKTSINTLLHFPIFALMWQMLLPFVFEDVQTGSDSVAGGGHLQNCPAGVCVVGRPQVFHILIFSAFLGLSTSSIHKSVGKANS